MLRCLPLAVLLALAGCAATADRAADLRAAPVVMLYTPDPPAAATRCVMRNIAERFADSTARLKETPGVEHREIYMSGGQVPMLIEVDPSRSGSGVQFHIPLPTEERMEVAIRLSKRC